MSAALERTAAASALVVIDMQNDFCHPDGVFAAAGLRVAEPRELVRRINVLVQAARDATRPVIWVRMEWPDDASLGLLSQRSGFLRAEGLRAGTWGAELVDGLEVAVDDPVVTKQRFSAFYRTELAEVLDRLGVGTLVMGGVRTDFCVESTVRDAFFRDYRALVAGDAVAGYVEELHQGSLRVMNTVFADVVPLEVAAEALRG